MNRQILIGPIQVNNRAVGLFRARSSQVDMKGRGCPDRRNGLEMEILLMATLAGLVGVADWGFRGEATALLRQGFLAALFPGAGHGALGIGFPGLVPVAERVAVPRRLRCDRRQPELIPYLAR